MSKFLSCWTPDTVIALVLILGSLVMMCLGIDGEVKSILTMAAGWAFGSSYVRMKAGSQ